MKHKPKTHTTQPQLPVAATQSEPPASVGGTTPVADATSRLAPEPGTAAAVTPHAHTGGSDTEPTLAELQAENATLKKQIAEQTAHTSLKDKLKQAGARTPQLLLGAAKDALSFTALGELENAVEIIEALKEKFPEQFGATPLGNNAPATAPAVPSIDAGAGRASAPTLTRDALAKMTPAQIAELNWDDVRRVLTAK